MKESWLILLTAITAQDDNDGFIFSASDLLEICNG